MNGIKILFTLCLVVTSVRSKSEHKRALIFPPTSLYGTFLAIAVPIDIPNKNVFVSYNFESNYSTLNNITEIDEVIFPNLPVVTSRQSRSISRELTYTILENRFQDPSSSQEEGIEDEYYEAEAAGHRGDCDKYLDDCPTSLFDYITRLVEFTHSKQ
ncbi:hypothetical protein SFRURICE_003329 [Spodoptera frugiperda]|nr:hypothetical protein SFRURICE_003329 [Spodoptera frugiperda]